ncbi:hypothetical protein C8A00DRAFT_36054 [Chaetomidium leptoderma]|uniref:Uncharacterized protein n=1 Tax=Chaetomidium leptoderma TaxID=669021 RepID=A0AAN6ZUE8_9PEZI|nr:hypothetical protein C8A00DRAFT_36054 [Chaetomidium leptoderma]
MDRTEALARLEPNLVDQFLQAASKSDVLRHTLESLVVDPVTADPVTDYITDLDERCQLFRELQQMNFLRVAAICGAAEAADEDYEEPDDSDEEVP